MKYNINRDREPLTGEDIDSGRNFFRAHRNYSATRKPLFRSKGMVAAGSAMVVAAALALIVLFYKDEEPVRPFIAPPFAAADISIVSYIVDADSATDIIYPSGSRIHIPSGAFHDAGGKPVKGKVQVKYREFRDQKDIFISGIPMTYDSAGQIYTFESAGMMQIDASQNNTALKVNPDAPLTVTMVAENSEATFNTYYLDTTARKWVNLKQPNLAERLPQASMAATDSVSEGNDLLGNEVHADYLNVEESEELEEAHQAVAVLEKQKPMPPVKADKAKLRFHIEVDPNEFPEVAIYEGVRFEFKDDSKVDAKKAKTQWSDIKLKKLNKTDYLMTFTRADDTLSIVGYPVLDEKDLPAAQKVYDEKYAEYDKKLAQRKASEVAAKAKWEADMKAAEETNKKAIARAQAQQIEHEKKAMAQMNADQRAAILEAKTRAAEQAKTYASTASLRDLSYRVFTVKTFGYYNSDNPTMCPQGASVMAKTVGPDGKEIKIIGDFYLVQKGTNALYGTHACAEYCPLNFNPNRENMLWGVTSDNKLAVVNAQSFKEQQKNSGKVVFKFELIDGDFKNSDEVKKYLEI